LYILADVFHLFILAFLYVFPGQIRANCSRSSATRIDDSKVLEATLDFVRLEILVYRRHTGYREPPFGVDRVACICDSICLTNVVLSRFTPAQFLFRPFILPPFARVSRDTLLVMIASITRTDQGSGFLIEKPPCELSPFENQSLDCL